MTRATRFLLCACLVGLLALSCRQHAEAADVDLLRKQMGMNEEIKKAEQLGDFEKLHRLLLEMRDLTTYREHEIKLVGLDEIDFYVQDVELALGFTGKQAEQGQEELDHIRQARVAETVGDFAAATENYQRSLELSEELYGEKSYKGLISRISLANAIRRSGENVERGIELAGQASDTLKELGKTDYHCYLEVQIALTRMYVRQKNDKQAIETGKLAIAMIEDRQLRQVSTYAEMTAAVAQALNHEKQFEGALTYAIKGLASSPAEKGKEAATYYQLLVESGKAKFGLEKPEEAVRDYALLVYKAEENSAITKENRLEILQEYAKILEKAGDAERLEIANRKIESLQRKIKGEVEFTGEKSRYSN
ncbi:hypothetical protein LOC68_03565 [Blastopirellula sp. JC732]|uniref:MalT-like TPR region domain-containing protein n=1 Tax=Blastopirellula sediminis TaxID=2894196 RepID=A0A9X1SEP7_9BACT|nr:hypothetical protein [Blastopirellula sediminis]MCC9607744.1 hypothetical protein [Blastopirellula sediminis]MCC9627463.1 hypothetical protein [Blastopirellula sediminis]